MKKSDIKLGFEFINTAGNIVKVIGIHGSGTRAKLASDGWKGEYHNGIHEIFKYLEAGYYKLIPKELYEIY